MGRVKSLIEKLEKLNVDEVIQESFEKNRFELLGYQRQQMLEGKTNQGTNITPGYLDDPYFKTKEAAQAYSNWKDRITPNPKRKKGTPNLFINGYFHNTITLKIQDGKLIFDSSFSGAKDIAGTFKNIYGLGGDIKKEFRDLKLRPTFLSEIRKAIK